MGKNKKNGIFAICFILIVAIVLGYFFVVKGDSKFIENVFNNIIGKKFENTGDVEVKDNTVINEIGDEFIDDETRYMRYLEASADFVKTTKREKKDVFCFAGDVYFSRRVREAYDKDGIDAILDKSYINELKAADLSVGNLECCITDDVDTPEDKTWTFALSSEYANGLKETEIDLFTLANNHILDYGLPALDDTIKALDSKGIAHIGAADNLYDAKKVYIKEIDGKRYAILAASAVLPNDFWKASKERGGVFNGYDAGAVAAEVKLLKNYFDKVIVYMHWGVELEETSNDYQKTAARRVIDAGADLVVGTHAHVVQEIEYYKGVPIIYSLGNFIYGGQVRDIIMLKATFDYSKNEKGTLTIKVMPGVSNYQKTKRYWNDDLSLRLENLTLKSVNCTIDEGGMVIPKYSQLGERN